jgi:hypothetical protein
MSTDTTVIPFRQPDAIDDPLTEAAEKKGARRMLAQVAMDHSAPSRPGLGLSRCGALQTRT